MISLIENDVISHNSSILFIYKARFSDCCVSLKGAFEHSIGKKPFGIYE